VLRVLPARLRKFDSQTRFFWLAALLCQHEVVEVS
jgi:hypothetical protein